MLAFRAIARPVAALRVRPVVAPRAAMMAMRFASTKKFSEDHEWVVVDNGVATIGITEYAQKALGDVVFVELPSVGSEIESGESIGGVESVKAASDIYAPVSGTVEEINEALGDQPSLVNKAAETDGWLAKIKLSEPGEVNELMDAEAYATFCEEQ
ncbi:hypothetical protein CcaverHIS002_0501500 [Cutaneotrichosporon cavernicola]|uniref:Glycine cleavage system H protein n=1 Tax=Cutaneotrichosporon cavernicola TaxID=279322 RepID=A0AA48QXT1_9TREE|nr:uncharacterized protein CcaverHIS019_0601510 [Cutaneotrichosporon cavernicola]BEI84749.1 hypothetical protein CcaverHIS002_0501500 [Cutaneotrichosporon cavernicola]BEI93692.1 hypothetical protein CcaverHIS019_0601510 [Cutaneotrichosporon cavernicola]BEJ01469.1 hypothetical protein CcaverHIS631_0601510 [Cutaneotrichosporon cavernicola]BEJ09235.1 hypothetical protein CcaverHIS641_0601500 [Cutaneotrichosporon cavernicola]